MKMLRILVLAVFAWALAACAAPGGYSSEIVAPEDGPSPTQVAETVERHGKGFLAALKPIGEWSAFYCLEPDCSSGLGYPKKDYLYPGQSIGCPTWVNIVLGYEYDLLREAAIPITRYVYILPGTCKVELR